MLKNSNLCEGKVDENINHPTDCTMYISCSNQNAYEMPCGDCNPHLPHTCLRGKLTFSLKHGDPKYGQCIDADKNECQEPTDPPGDECDPDDCETKGYCQHYFRCDKDSRKWVRDECGQDLVWNPRGDGEIHGGNCDFWSNLDKDVEDEYRKDPECLACFWEETGACEPKYRYQAPGLSHRTVQTLSCSKGLVFSLAKETCQRPEDVDGCKGEAEPEPEGN